jgi:organic hydroperoxide reductase OsmC/OhrA
VQEYKEKGIITDRIENDDSLKQKVINTGKRDAKQDLSMLNEELLNDSVSQCFSTMLNSIVF